MTKETNQLEYRCAFVASLSLCKWHVCLVPYFPLRAVTPLMRKKIGHTAVIAAIKQSVQSVKDKQLAIRINLNRTLSPKNRRCRNQSSMAFQTPSANKDAYKKSFFPKISRTGMTSLILSSPLLNCRTTVYLNSLPL